MSKKLVDKIYESVEDVVKDLGFEIVQIDIKNEGKSKLLSFLIDNIEIGKTVSIDDCSKISSLIAPIIDLHNFIDSNYLLEVSSAGVSRPLNKFFDYIKFKGTKICVKLKKPLYGKYEFIGILGEIISNETNEEIDLGSNLEYLNKYKISDEFKIILNDEENILSILMSNIKSANLYDEYKKVNSKKM